LGGRWRICGLAVVPVEVEEGETIAEGARRELTEEAGLIAKDLSQRGLLRFNFDDKPQPWEVHGGNLKCLRSP